MATDTQLQAWSDKQESLPRSQKLVLSALALGGPSTSFEVARILGQPINRISGRITELREKGKIKDSGERTINPDSGKRVIVWCVQKSVNKSEFCTQ